MTQTARRTLALPLLFAAAKLLLHLPFLHRFGIHHDELYFLACGRHLGLGYVDHAPFVPWVARLVEELHGPPLGDPGLVALRLPAVLAGAAALGLAVWLAQRLGGGRLAQVAVGLAMLAAPVYVRATAMLTIPAFEPLVWVAVGHLLLSIVRHDRPRLWLAVGAVCGLGLWIKHSTLFLGFGLAVALLATSHRRHLRSKWLWAGGGLAALIFLPHLAWQGMHGWPTAAFLANLNAEVMSGVHPLQFVFGQLVYLNPATAPLWIAGLWIGLRRTRGPSDDVRSLYAWIWLGVFVLLLVLGSKIYYLAPAYPILLAAGAVTIESWCRREADMPGRDPALRPLRAGGLLALLVAGGLWMAPLNLPIFSLERTEAYIDAITFGAFDNVYELTADLRGQFGWEERVEAVADAWHGLPDDERERAVILGEWYGPAGAVDLYGPARGLPPAFSTHLGYHLWGPPPAAADVYVYVMAGHDPEDLEAYFGDVSVVRRLELEKVNPWHTPFVISVAREPKVDVAEAWPALRSY